MAALELVVRHLSPREVDDPPLGPVAFWLWVLLIPSMTYALWPFLERGERVLDRLAFRVRMVGWLASKLGVTGSWKDSPREPEQVWATTDGTLVG